MGRRPTTSTATGLTDRQIFHRIREPEQSEPSPVNRTHGARSPRGVLRAPFGGVRGWWLFWQTAPIFASKGVPALHKLVLLPFALLLILACTTPTPVPPTPEPPLTPILQPTEVPTATVAPTPTAIATPTSIPRPAFDLRQHRHPLPPTPRRRHPWQLLPQHRHPWQLLPQHRHQFQHHSPPPRLPRHHSPPPLLDQQQHRDRPGRLRLPRSPSTGGNPCSSDPRTAKSVMNRVTAIGSISKLLKPGAI